MSKRLDFERKLLSKRMSSIEERSVETLCVTDAKLFSKLKIWSRTRGSPNSECFQLAADRIIMRMICSVRSFLNVICSEGMKGPYEVSPRSENQVTSYSYYIII